MSTIDKQVRLAQLDRELYSKQADIAYKAFNGTKQSVRNFREGTLDIGKMNFDNTAQDRITKEMVTDYHKKEQERYDAQLQGKTETGLSSTIEAELVNPVVHNFGSLRRPASSEDLERRQEEMARTASEIGRLDKIIRDVPKRNSEISFELKSDKVLLEPTRTLYLALIREKSDNERDMRAALRDRRRLEQRINDLQTEMAQIEQNIKDNEQGIINANIKNKEVAKKYEDAFNALNQNLYSIKQEPHESEQAYIQRIKQLDTMKYDPQLFADKAELENSKQLMRNLKEVISDDGKISEIVKSLEPNIVFDVNKYWAKIKDTILKIYGPNNKQATVKNYLEFIKAILETIYDKGSVITVIPSANPRTTTSPAAPVTAPASTGSASPVVWSDSDDDDEFEDAPSILGHYQLVDDDKTLYFTPNAKPMYIKIGKDEKANDQILYSKTGQENTFVKFDFKNPKNINNWNRFLRSVMWLDVNGNYHEDYVKTFGSNFTKPKIFTYLKTKLKLKITSPLKSIRQDTGDHITGWGMKNEEVPKLAHFGKNIILLDKLFHKNILSIKNKKMHSVEHFPNVKVSDTLTDIIYNMCIKNTKPTKEMLNSLKSNERKLFDLLLYVSGIGKNIGLTTAKEEHVKELKGRLQLVESQLRSGNNNPVVKSELKEIIQKLYLYNAISMNNGKAYLKQF